MTKARVLSDSLFNGSRCVTIECEYPRYILSQVNTHRVFSRNTASSRAIPLETNIKLIQSNPVIPTWTGNQPGMVGTHVDKETRVKADKIWLQAKDAMIGFAEQLAEIGIHKQNANRLLEPFSTVKTIITSTDWDNFFNLRIAEDAQPEIQELAVAIKEALDGSTPVEMTKDMAHTPYINDGHSDKKDVNAILGSAAACAQVSYRRLNTEPEALNRIITRLINGGRVHASPFEHVCVGGSNGLGNLRGFSQLRHGVERSINLAFIKKSILDGSIWLQEC
jgi:thymidylate synthase ThyX